MKKIISLTLALIMAATIFIVPGGAAVYADNGVVPTTENTTDNTQSEGEGEQITEEETRDISDATVTFGYKSYNYTGEYRKPIPKVLLEDETLTLNEDYTLSYKNNFYPGKATVIITGINAYKGSIEANFEIAKVLNFKTTAVGTDYIKLSWGGQKNITGYKIYSYSSAKGKWILRKTVKAPNKSCTLEDLGEGYNYMLRIKSYVGTKYGSPSDNLYVPTKPGRVEISSATTSPKLTATIKWKKENCTGYEVLVSGSSKFTNTTEYTLNSKDSLSKKLTELKKGKAYYIKVRAYKTYRDRTSYGQWSKYKKITGTTTGWLTEDGKKYYYKNGEPITGQQTINGSPYYFSKSAKGKLMGADYEMWKQIKDKKSNTNYLIAVSRKHNRTCVYYKKDKVWTLKYYWKCTTGEIGIWTPRGSFLVPKTKTHLKSFGDSTFDVWYATRFKGACYFHSILYRPGSQTKIVDGRLGQNLSHGCVRLKLENAKWLYDNINPGTRVVVY